MDPNFPTALKSQSEQFEVVLQSLVFACSRVANVPCTNPIMIVALLQHRVWLGGAPFKEFSLWLCATTETPGAWGRAPCDSAVSRLPGKCAFASIQAFDIPSLEDTQMYHHQNGFAFDNA